MSLDDLYSLIARWPDLVIVALVVGPIIWAILNWTYRNRIEGLREDVDRLRLRDEEARLDLFRRGQVSHPTREEDEVPDSRFQISARGSEYPAHFAALPKAEPSERAYMPPNAAREIRMALKAMPPLARAAAGHTAYVGKWVRESGEITRVDEMTDSIVVFVKGEGRVFYILSFTPSERLALEPLREGQTIRFEGQIHSVEEDIVELLYPSFELS